MESPNNTSPNTSSNILPSNTKPQFSASPSPAPLKEDFPASITNAKPLAYPDNALDLIADFFELLSDPNRLQILCALTAGSRTPESVSICLGIHQETIRQNLQKMTDAGIVQSKISQGRPYFEVCNPHILKLCELVGPALHHSTYIP